MPGWWRAGVVCSWRVTIILVGVVWRVAEESVYRVDCNRHSSSSVELGASAWRQRYESVCGTSLLVRLCYLQIRPRRGIFCRSLHPNIFLVRP